MYTAHLIRESDLKRQIQLDLTAQVANMKDKKYISKIRAKLEQQMNNDKKELKQLQKELSKLEMKKENLIDLVADGKVEAQFLNDFLLKNDAAINKLKSKIIQIQNRPDVSGEIEEKMKVVQSMIDELLKFDDITPEVVNRFISKIVVDKAGSPQIFYRFAD